MENITEDGMITAWGGGGGGETNFEHEKPPTYSGYVFNHGLFAVTGEIEMCLSPNFIISQY